MSEERPWENTSEVPQRFQEVAAGNENAGPFQPSKAHHHAENQELETGNSKADNPADQSAKPAADTRSENPTSAEESAALPPAGALPTEEDVLEALKDVIDPELGINIVDLGNRRDDPHFGCLSAYRYVGRTNSMGAWFNGQQSTNQLGVDAAVGAGSDYGRRARTVTRSRL